MDIGTVPEDGGNPSPLKTGSLSARTAVPQLSASGCKQGTTLRQISELLVLPLFCFNFSLTCKSSAGVLLQDEEKPEAI